MHSVERAMWRSNEIKVFGKWNWITPEVIQTFRNHLNSTETPAFVITMWKCLRRKKDKIRQIGCSPFAAGSALKPNQPPSRQDDKSDQFYALRLAARLSAAHTAASSAHLLIVESRHPTGPNRSCHQSSASSSPSHAHTATGQLFIAGSADQTVQIEHQLARCAGRQSLRSHLHRTLRLTAAHPAGDEQSDRAGGHRTGQAAHRKRCDRIAASANALQAGRLGELLQSAESHG